MDFLRLCQRARLECGIQGEGPTTVLNQFGAYGLLVDWIADAWVSLQREHDNWLFRWRRDPITLTQGQALYTPADLGLGSGDKLLSLHLDSQPISLINWEEAKSNGIRSDLDSATAGPLQTLIEQPDGLYRAYPAPDADLTLDAEYCIAIQQLSESLDVPLMPERYHMMLVWAAVMQFAFDQDDANLAARGREQYERLWQDLADDQLPAVTTNHTQFMG